MKFSSGLGRVAGMVTAAGLLTLMVGCASSRYERTTGEFVDDQMLERRVSGALNAQPVYKYPDVHVHAYRGVVQLGGFVATEQQRAAATEIARRVRGVGEVENALSLANLSDMSLRNFIPGRENESGTNQARNVGAPFRNVYSEHGGASSSTNAMNRANGNSDTR
jgi:hyperosmotically inducible periplasmic protein